MENDETITAGMSDQKFAQSVLTCSLKTTIAKLLPSPTSDGSFWRSPKHKVNLFSTHTVFLRLDRVRQCSPGYTKTGDNHC